MGITTVANSTSGISSPFQYNSNSERAFDNSYKSGREDEGDVRRDRVGVGIGEGIAIRKVIST